MAAGYSYNDWPANSDPSAIGIDSGFGASVGAPGFGSGGYVGGVKSGDVTTVFRYLIDALQEIEPMMYDDGGNGYGCWGYSYRDNVNNPGQLSCHASGTAIDYSAPRHPNGTSTGPNGGGGWTGDQYRAIMAILDGPLQGCISWLTSNDPMHFEIDADADQLARVAESLGGASPSPSPEPEPIKDDDMPRRIVTVYDNELNAVAQALDGPTGVVVLFNPDELAMVQAVIDDDTMVNQTQIDAYNEVLRRGVNGRY